MYKTARFYRLNKGFQRLFALIGFLLLLASGLFSIAALIISPIMYGSFYLTPLEALMLLIIPPATWFVYWFLIAIYLWIYDGFVGLD